MIPLLVHDQFLVLKSCCLVSSSPLLRWFSYSFHFFFLCEYVPDVLIDFGNKQNSANNNRFIIWTQNPQIGAVSQRSPSWRSNSGGNVSPEFITLLIWEWNAVISLCLFVGLQSRSGHYCNLAKCSSLVHVELRILFEKGQANRSRKWGGMFSI